MGESLLYQSFKDHTIVWLLLTSIIGGILGAAIKILSDNIISQNIISTRQAKIHFNDYSFKLLKAAKHLDRRLDFIINDKRIFPYNEVNSVLSFFYAVGNYFGWCKIIQEDALDKFKRLPKTVKVFNICFLQTLKGWSSNFYFTELSSLEEMITKGAIIPNYCHTAIGDLMLSDIEANKTIVKSPILSFNEFCERYNSNADMREWFTYFEKLFVNMAFDEQNLGWNRLLIISLNLKILICSLDKRNRFVAPYNNLPHLKGLHKKVLLKVESDFVFLKGKKIAIPKAFNYNG